MNALDTLLFWVQTNNHPIYEKYLVDLYEDEHGAHFDETHAHKAVERMRHHDMQGVFHKGEHWTIEEVREAIEPYGIEDNNTCWDAYVALHVWWHDLSITYKRRGHENDIIEDAVKFFFMDEDADEGKIWRYVHMWK